MSRLCEGQADIDGARDSSTIELCVGDIVVVGACGSPSVALLLDYFASATL